MKSLRERAEELLRASEAATPGPWDWRLWAREEVLTANHGRRDIILSGAYTRNENGVLDPAKGMMPNMAFIALSRNEAPALARALLAALDVVEAVRDASLDYPSGGHWTVKVIAAFDAEVTKDAR